MHVAIIIIIMNNCIIFNYIFIYIFYNFLHFFYGSKFTLSNVTEVFFSLMILLTHHFSVEHKLEKSQFFFLHIYFQMT